MFAGFFWFVPAEAQIARATEVVAKGRLTLFGRTIVRLMETRAILARHVLALKMKRVV